MSVSVGSNGWYWRKTFILTKATYRSSAISVKMPTTFFPYLEKYPRIHLGTPNKYELKQKKNKANLSPKNIILSANMKIYYKAIIIETC